MLYQICFYVPSDALEKVKNALFEAGAGKIGHYSHCAWQTLGQGQFLPLANSNPHLGMHHQLEMVQEYKVEMVCDQQVLQAALDAFHYSGFTRCSR